MRSLHEVPVAGERCGVIIMGLNSQLVTGLVLKDERRPREDGFGVSHIHGRTGPTGHYGAYGTIGSREPGESRITKYPLSVQRVYRYLHIFFHF